MDSDNKKDIFDKDFNTDATQEILPQSEWQEDIYEENPEELGATAPIPVIPDKPSGGKKGIFLIIGILAGIVVILAAVIMFLLLNKNTESNKGTSAALSASATSSASITEPTTSSVSASASSALQAQPYIGVYEYTGSYTKPKYRPKIVLRDDGTFAGIANLYEAMGWCEGTYTVEDKVISVTITSADFFSPGSATPYDKGWNLGAEHGIFEIMDNNNLRFMGPENFLPGVGGDDILTRNSEADIAPVKFDEPGIGHVFAEGGLNLRSAPSTSAEKYVLIPDKSSVDVWDRVVGENGDIWYRVTYDGKEGYVSGEYLYYSRP